MGRGAVALKRGPTGKLGSARSKTGDPQCSAAMSAKVNARYGNPVSMALDVANKILGMCRAKAMAFGKSRSHEVAGNTAKSQVWAKRAERGLSGKGRLEMARKLQAQRKSKSATPKPSLREQAKPFVYKPLSNAPERAALLAERNNLRKLRGRHNRLKADVPKHFEAEAKAGPPGDAAQRARLHQRAGKLAGDVDKLNATPKPFHEAAQAAAEKVPASKLQGGNKALLHHVHEAHQADPSNPRMSLDTFKAKAVEAKAKLPLGRHDMVQTITPAELAKSDAHFHMGGKVAATFNHIRVGAKAGPSLKEQADQHRLKTPGRTEKADAIKGERREKRLAAARAAAAQYKADHAKQLREAAKSRHKPETNASTRSPIERPATRIARGDRVAKAQAGARRFEKDRVAMAPAKAPGRGTPERATLAVNRVKLRKQLNSVKADLAHHDAKWAGRKATQGDESRNDRLDELAALKRQIDRLKTRKKK